MEHPVEIKVNIDGDVDAALSVLGLSRRGRNRRIWFADASRSPRGRPVCAAFRKRHRTSPVRLRRRQRSDGQVETLQPDRLVGRWASSFTDSDSEFAIEGDWSGSDRVVSASAVRVFPRGAFGGRLTAAEVVAALNALQRRLLAECAASASLDGLELLGPVRSTKWSDVRLSRRFDVSAERWKVAGLDFLELSTKVGLDDGDDAGSDFDAHARACQAELVSSVIERDLTIEAAGDKTQRVLLALATGG